MRAPARLSYGRIPNLVELKDLIATQVESFSWFKNEGLRELFDEINPITDYTGKNFELKFLDYEFGQPKFSVEECRNRDMTYAAPLRIARRTAAKLPGSIPCAAGPTTSAATMVPLTVPLGLAGHAGFPPPPQKKTMTPPLVCRWPK